MFVEVAPAAPCSAAAPPRDGKGSGPSLRHWPRAALPGQLAPAPPRGRPATRTAARRGTGSAAGRPCERHFLQSVTNLCGLSQFEGKSLHLNVACVGGAAQPTGSRCPRPRPVTARPRSPRDRREQAQRRHQEAREHRRQAERECSSPRRSPRTARRARADCGSAAPASAPAPRTRRRSRCPRLAVPANEEQRAGRARAGATSSTATPPRCSAAADDHRPRRGDSGPSSVGATAPTPDSTADGEPVDHAVVDAEHVVHQRRASDR